MPLQVILGSLVQAESANVAPVSRVVNDTFQKYCGYSILILILASKLSLIFNTDTDTGFKTIVDNDTEQEKY